MKRVALDSQPEVSRQQTGDRATHGTELRILAFQISIRNSRLVLDVLSFLEPAKERAELSACRASRI
jgi:hypothetical protein